MIYAFYSYKGGVGRTLVMAHCAIAMAKSRREQGYRVLAMDLDLEAPGLARYISPRAETGAGGFARLLADYRAQGRRRSWLEEHILDTAYIGQLEGANNLYVMPTGVEPGAEMRYATVAEMLRDELTIAAAAQSEGGQARPGGFFGDLRDLLSARFQYVLVDSRTGLSDPAYVSTIHLADCIVCCVRLNEGNIRGTRLVIGNALKRKGGGPRMPLVVVATPVPARGGEDVEKWIERAERLAPPTSDDDPAILHRSLFPKVIRIFHDPGLELGEHLVYTPSGEIAKGYSIQTPIVETLLALTKRLTVENCDKDAAAAAAVEVMLHNKRDYERAIQYLFKRILIEPTNRKNWDDLSKGYPEAPLSWARVRVWLDDTINRWRIEAEGGADVGEVLALAHYYRARYFGKSSPDAGLADAEEALKLSEGHALEDEAALVAGQVVEELVAVRERFGVPSGSKELTLETANQHYTRCIELCKTAGTPAGNAWQQRAQNLVRLDRYKEALKDYDAWLGELSRDEHASPKAVSTILFNQSQVLEHLGWYLADVRNLLKASALQPEDADVARRLGFGAGEIRLLALAKERIELSGRLGRTDEKLHYAWAVYFLMEGDLAAALESARVARAFSGKRTTFVVLATIQTLLGSYEDADATLREVKKNDRDYHVVALHACVRAWLKDKDPLRELIGLRLKDYGWVSGVAALAAGEPERIRLGAGDKAASYDGSSMRIFVRLMQRSACGKWNQKEARQLESRFAGHPYLAARFSTLSEIGLVRQAWQDLVDAGRTSEPGTSWIQSVWKRLNEAQPPPEALLTPRDPSRPVELDSQCKG